MAKLIFKNIYHEMMEDEKETYEFQISLHDQDYGSVDRQMVQGIVEKFFSGMKAFGQIGPVLFLELLKYMEEYIEEMQDTDTITQHSFKHLGHLFYNDPDGTLKKFSDLHECFLTKKQLSILNKNKKEMDKRIKKYNKKRKKQWLKDS